MVPASGILDIIIIIYYFPALLLAIYVGLKHGFSRSAGWFNLNLLSLFRLTGSSLGLAAIYGSNTGVVIASIVFSSMGTISLIGALLGLIGRANESLKERSLRTKLARYIQLATIAAIVLAAIGGNYAFNSDPDTRSEGHTLSRAAIILLIVIYVAAVVIAIHTLIHRHLLPQSERRLLHVCLISLPFVLVRLILAVCSIFLYTNSVFSAISTTHTAVIVRALMGVLMEFIVVALFLWAGCTINRSAERDAERARRHGANGRYMGEQGPVHSSNIETPENAYTQA